MSLAAYIRANDDAEMIETAPHCYVSRNFLENITAEVGVAHDSPIAHMRREHMRMNPATGERNIHVREHPVAGGEREAMLWASLRDRANPIPHTARLRSPHEIRWDFHPDA